MPYYNNIIRATNLTGQKFKHTVQELAVIMIKQKQFLKGNIWR